MRDQIKEAVKARKRVARRLTTILEGFRLSLGFQLVLFVASCAIGVAVYSGLVCLFYGRLYDACVRADVLTEAFDEIPASDWERTSAKQVDEDRVFSLLEYYQLLSDEEAIPSSLEDAQSPNNGIYRALISLKPEELRPTVGLIWRILRASGAEPTKSGGSLSLPVCESDPTLCEAYYDASVGAAIAQLPSPLGVSGDGLSRSAPSLESRTTMDGLDGFFPFTKGAEVHTTLNVDSGRLGRTKINVLRLLHGIRSSNYWFRLERPGPEKTPEQIASALALKWSSSGPTKGWYETVQKKKLEKFVALLLSKTRGSPDVRSARIWVNGIIGWERLAVIVLGIYFLLLWLQRGLARRRHERAKKDMMRELLAFEVAGKTWSPLGERLIATKALLDAGDKEHFSTIPYTIVRAAYEQMEARQKAANNDDLPTKSDGQSRVESGDPVATDHVGLRAAQERQELDNSRTAFEFLLPTFPAIGFIGTVSSLLIAMSQADRIVSTTDPLAKGLAASQVTDILSLCFSTTFLALCAVLVFSPLSMLQHSREHHLVDDIHRLVEMVLRPSQ